MERFWQFLQDEAASVSIWNLFWFTGFCLIMGLAVDVSAGMKSKARLQHVADAAAHAGVMDISPNPQDARVTALDFGVRNLGWIKDVVTDADIDTGYWDYEARTFTPESPRDHNAVRVFSNRLNDRSNGVDLTMLAMARAVTGLEAWDVRAAAVAAHIRLEDVRCLANGLFAGGTMEQTSNNTFVAPFCVYGHNKFKINNNNRIECGVVLQTPDPSGWQTGKAPAPGIGPCNTDYLNLGNDQMIEQSLTYDTMPVIAQYEYDTAKIILEDFIAGRPVNDPFHVIPPWMASVADVAPLVFNALADSNGLVPGTLYVVSCATGGGKLELSGIVRNVGVYTDCEITVKKDQGVTATKAVKTVGGKKVTCGTGGGTDGADCDAEDWLAEIDRNNWTCAGAVTAGFDTYKTELDTTGSNTYRDGTVDMFAEECGIEPGASGVWDNVLIFSSYLEGGNTNLKAMSFPNNMQLGRIDGCTEGGAVRIYAAGSVNTPSGTTAHGLQIVTLGSVRFAAKANGGFGITIHALKDIKYAAGGLMGGCGPDSLSRTTEVVITARPIAIVQ